MTTSVNPVFMQDISTIKSSYDQAVQLVNDGSKTNAEKLETCKQIKNKISEEYSTILNNIKDDKYGKDQNDVMWNRLNHIHQHYLTQLGELKKKISASTRDKRSWDKNLLETALYPFNAAIIGPTLGIGATFMSAWNNARYNWQLYKPGSKDSTGTKIKKRLQASIMAPIGGCMGLAEGVLFRFPKVCGQGFIPGINKKQWSTAAIFQELSELAEGSSKSMVQVIKEGTSSKALGEDDDAEWSLNHYEWKDKMAKVNKQFHDLENKDNTKLSFTVDGEHNLNITDITTSLKDNTHLKYNYQSLASGQSIVTVSQGNSNVHIITDKSHTNIDVIQIPKSRSTKKLAQKRYKKQVNISTELAVNMLKKSAIIGFSLKKLPSRNEDIIELMQAFAKKGIVLNISDTQLTGRDGSTYILEQQEKYKEEAISNLVENLSTRLRKINKPSKPMSDTDREQELSLIEEKFAKIEELLNQNTSLKKKITKQSGYSKLSAAFHESENMQLIPGIDSSDLSSDNDNDNNDVKQGSTPTPTPTPAQSQPQPEPEPEPSSQTESQTNTQDATEQKNDESKVNNSDTGRGNGVKFRH